MDFVQRKNTLLSNTIPILVGVVLGTLVCMSIYSVGPLFGREQQSPAVVVDENGNILQDLRPYVGTGATAPVYGPLTVVGGFIGMLLVIYIFTLIRDQVDKINLRRSLLRQ